MFPGESRGPDVPARTKVAKAWAPAFAGEHKVLHLAQAAAIVVLIWAQQTGQKGAAVLRMRQLAAGR
jgi:hypothetical protein